MSATTENNDDHAMSIRDLAAKCRREHVEIKNNILALTKTLESGLVHLTMDDILLVGANLKTLSNLLSDLDPYIVAIQVSFE